MKRSGTLAGFAAGIAVCVAVLAGFSSNAVAAGQGKSTPTPASYRDVTVAVLPLAKEFMKTFQRTKRSQKQVEKQAWSIYTDYNDLKQLTIHIPARVKGDHSRRGRAYYHFEALFKGAIKPKNQVEIRIDKNAEAHRYYDRGLLLGIGSTRHPGPFGIVTPRLWTFSGWIAGRGFRRFDSCSIKGARRYNPGLSTQILDAGMREAITVLRQARHHRPLKRQKDVFAGMKPAEGCP